MYAFIEREKATHSVRQMCRVLGICPSGYWAWRRRPISARAQESTHLISQIKTLHQQSRGCYGAPRIHAELVASGVPCGRKRVARLMRHSGVVGRHRRRVVTTRRADEAERAADLVQRDVSASEPNHVWVADITYVPTKEGFLSLAVILDVWSRRVVGWAMASHLQTSLVLSALQMALARRRPPPGVIHHSDHGCQYTASACRAACRRAGVRCSRGSVGDCYDNALAERFFATLDREVLMTTIFHTRLQARTALFDYLESFYNRQRRHSALGYLSPLAFERRDTQHQQANVA